MIITPKNMAQVLSQIISRVKMNNNSILYHDEPYMKLMAEWQDWSFARAGLTQLHLGYFSGEDGDIGFDPLFVFTFLNDAITEIQMTLWSGRTLPAPTNDPYIAEFLELVWDRHFMNRVERVERI